MKRLSLLLLVALAPLFAYAQDADSLKIKPVSLGVLLQTNLSGEHVHSQQTNLNTNAGFGMEVGGYVDYNITDKLCFELQLIFSLQGLGHITKSAEYDAGGVNDEMITLFGTDIPLLFMARLPVRESRLRLGAGPFSHITFDAWHPSHRELVTPYRQIISIDDVTGRPRYALNSFYAGVSLLAGWEFPSGLQINLGGFYSVMDILNYEHGAESFNHPYKISLGLGWRF